MSVDVQTGDVLMFRLEFGLDEEHAYNILHYRVTSIIDTVTGLPAAVTIPGNVALPAMGLSMFTALAATWAATASQDIAFAAVTAQDVYPGDRSRPYTYIPGAPVPGTVASDALPMQDSPTLLKRTAFGQRWGLGRIFVVGLSEADQADGIVTGGYVTRVDAWATVLESSRTLTVGAYDVHVSPVLHVDRHASLSPPRPAYTRTTPIVAIDLSNDIIKTQRRRRPGKGI